MAHYASQPGCPLKGAGGFWCCFIYLYVCISAGPCLPGATRLRRVMCQSLFSSPGFPLFICYQVCSQAYGCLQISKLGLSYLLIVARGQTFNLPLTVLPRSGWSPGGSPNPSKFQAVPGTLPNHQKAPPGTRKPPKMRSQDVSEALRIANRLKK